MADSSAIDATLIHLLISQLFGAAGDALGSRLSRVVFRGSPERMIIATSVVGILLTLSCLLLLDWGGIVEVRFGHVLRAPDLWVANGILAAAYSAGEAYLLLYSYGAVIKSITPLAAPAVLFFAERQGWFEEPQGGIGGGERAGSHGLMFAVGTIGALLLASLGWDKRAKKHHNVAAAVRPFPTTLGTAGTTGDAPPAAARQPERSTVPLRGASGTRMGADTMVPATITLTLCNTGWNGLQRVSFTKHHVNSCEWLLLDKVIGGAFALALLAIKARRSGESLEWTAALQDSMSSVSAAVATVCYVMLQLLRLALVFLIIGTGSTGVYGNLAVILDPFSRIFTAHFSLCNTCRVGVMQVGVPCHP